MSGFRVAAAEQRKGALPVKACLGTDLNGKEEFFDAILGRFGDETAVIAAFPEAKSLDFTRIKVPCETIPRPYDGSG